MPTGNEGEQVSGAAQGQTQENAGETQVVAFDEWIAKQPETVKAAIDEHVNGLKSALDAERGQRKTLERQLRDVSKKADEGSDFQKQLLEVADKMAEADRKAEFYDAAHKAGVTDLALAYMAATVGEMFDRHGKVNFEELKTTHPALFGTVTIPKGNPGNGNNQQPAAQGMNEYIRRAAGRK